MRYERRASVEVVGIVLAVFGSFFGGVVGVRAQSPLEEVERLTRLGRTEEARTALAAWWEGDRSDASRRELQRGLWLRGRLTVDPVQAELDFQRLAVMYPSGQFTPDAIFRLAQASWSMGDEEAARRYVATLERDYPRSPARERARAWLDDPGPLPPRGDTPTRPTAADPTESASATREGAPGRDVRDAPDDTGRSGRAPESAARPDDVGDVGEGAPAANYYVQLGAFADEDRALALYEAVREAGVAVRLVEVEGSRFVHVRVGRFAERAAAVELLDELAARGVDGALVRDDRAERPLR